MGNFQGGSNLLNKTIKTIATSFDGGVAGAEAVATTKQKNDAYQLGQAGFDSSYVERTVGVHPDIEAARKSGESEIGMDKTKRSDLHKSPYK